MFYFKRYSKLAFAETQELFVCTEKQATDKKILAGLEHELPMNTSSSLINKKNRL